MTASTVRLLGISGSLRKASYNTGLLRAAGELLPVETTLELFDLSALPLYNDDVRLLSFPEPARMLRERIAGADALLIACPEYNYSISGVLKNAIDWASRPPEAPILRKPVGIMGAATGNLGTVRAQMHLRDVCVYLDMRPLNKPEILVARAAEKFDAEIRLTDQPTRDLMKTMLAALADWTRLLRGR
jgi:chromate reductase